MSKRIPQRNVNLSDKYIRTIQFLLDGMRSLGDVNSDPQMQRERFHNIEEQLIDALAATREFRRKPIQRNDIT